MEEAQLYERGAKARSKEQRRGGGAATARAAPQPRSEEGQYPELQVYEEGEELWESHVMPPAPPRAFQPGYPKGIQSKASPTKNPKGPPGKRMPRVAQLAGPLPPPPPPPPLPLPTADMAAPLNDCAVTMAALD
eukprot:scaffold35727_cov43-Phaeocystis_antarctica.AAC.3